jgi:membrane protease YdiL (CAAX protease family)
MSDRDSIPGPPSSLAAELEPETAPRRIPNLGHALIFLAGTFLLLLLTQGILLSFGKVTIDPHKPATVVQHPELQLAAMAATYLITLLAASLFFSKIWRRPFLEGIRWNARTALAHASRLIPVGLLLGMMVQCITYFIRNNKAVPIDSFFLKATDAWLITVFGTFVAPVFEEICFRGFLLPAFAIAYDWLSLPRTPAAVVHWQTTATLSPVALLFSAILSSALFACIHGQQLGWAAPGLCAIFAVSLILTLVRVRTRSVAASTLVHATYNFFIFLVAFIATGGYRHLDRMTQ